MKFNWTRKEDGRLVSCTHVRVEYSLSRNELADVLCASGLHVTGDDLTAAEIEKAIRLVLSTHADSRFYWHEGLDDSADAAARITWAREQVLKL